MKFVYLGDKLTDPRLVDQECDPVLRADGQPAATPKRTLQLVRFADGELVVVLGRRLRLTQPDGTSATENVESREQHERRRREPLTVARGLGGQSDVPARSGITAQRPTSPEHSEAPGRL